MASLIRGHTRLHRQCQGGSSGTALLRLVLVALCLLAAIAPLCFASPPSYRADIVSYDSRVAELRRTLREIYHVQNLPDPPLELGIHTPCKKFGRGCPDTYVAFLEDVLASLRPVVAAARGDETSTKEKNNTKKEEEENGKAAPQASTKSDTPPDKRNGAEDKEEEALQVSPISSSPTLRLPVQVWWSYADFKRLESLLIRVKVAEVQLERRGVASLELQSRYRVPRGANITLQDDVNGELSAHLSHLCASLTHSQFSLFPAEVISREEQSLHELWCKYVERKRQAAAAGAEASPLQAAVPLTSLPAPPILCYKVEAQRWYAESLLALDPLLTFLVSFTVRVGLPSACAAAVILWVCVGDGWGDEAERLIFNELDTSWTAPSSREGQEGNAEEREEADANAADCLAEQRYRQSRSAGLRYTFLACVQHRAWPMRFLKLRLLLCLLVAADLVWNLAQILWFQLLRPTSSGGGGVSSYLTKSVNLVLLLLPVWVRVVINTYVIVALQGAVLLMALKGAASSYADWLDFTAKCATEQEYLLKAVAELTHHHHHDAEDD